MEKLRVEVLITDRKQLYCPGDEISGQVILEISEELKVKSKIFFTMFMLFSVIWIMFQLQKSYANMTFGFF